MITKNTVTLFTATDGTEHKDIESAKLASLTHLLDEVIETPDDRVSTVAKELLKCSDRIIDILTTTASSLPKARRLHGGRKPRKSKQLEIPAETYAPVKGDPSLGSTVAA